MKEIGKQELRDILCEVLAIPKLTPVIESQIHRFKMELGFTYKEIAQALVFYIEEKNGKYESMYGIGIVPNVMEESRAYFKRKKIQQEIQLKSIEKASKQTDIILNITKVKERKKAIIPIDMEKLDIE